MNAKESLIRYYDELLRFALSKCGSQQDAEDLVSDTMLAAFEYIRKGETIKCPKTWLANTLMHKWNGLLRKKYSTPAMVQLDSLSPLSDPLAEIEYDDTDEVSELRLEIAYLARLSRDMLIREICTSIGAEAAAAAMSLSRCLPMTASGKIF